MVLESAQMLCTAVNENGGKAPYKSTHKNHPANVWARETRSNYCWLLEHFKGLCQEYTHRFNKEHKCSQLIDFLKENNVYTPTGPLTKFANCAAHKDKGLNFKNETDVVLAYQLYLNKRFKTDTRKPIWTNRQKPSWVVGVS